MSQRQATKEQQQIIEATEGNIRVRAVPGSGKTFALTKRIVYLILELYVEPSSIVAMTFRYRQGSPAKENQSHTRSVLSGVLFLSEKTAR